MTAGRPGHVQRRWTGGHRPPPQLFGDSTDVEDSAGTVSQSSYPPATSAFLDVLRIAAALVVFVNHLAQFWSPRTFAVTAPVAHGAVVVFFVLSGYVIAYSTLAREQSVRRCAVARLSRLYSVVIPALLLTWLLQRWMFDRVALRLTSPAGNRA